MKKYSLLMGTALLSMVNAGSAVAQDAMSTPASAAVEDAAPAVGEIIVSGRKRDERLLDAPLSITALSADKLNELQLKSLSDIAKISPGFKFEQQSFTNGFRVLSQVRFRGMTSFNPRPNNQVGAIFVDGNYVAAGSSSLNTDDVERVEVIKGPQNAYFGRNTFAGAVNFITRVPSDEFKASFRAKVENYDGYDFGASIEGTIIPDILTGRLLANAFQNGGQFDSGDGAKLGRQTTRGIAGTLYFTPSDRLTMRVRGSLQRDEDWGNVVQNYSGNDASCKIGATAYYCGALPTNGDTYTRVAGGTFAVSRAMIYQDTSLIPPALVAAGRPNALRDMISNSNGAFADVPFYDQLPTIDHFGSTSRSLRLTASADYELGGGFTLSGQFGYGNFRSMSLRDDDSILGFVNTRPSCAPAQTQACRLNATTFLMVPFWARDLSAEGRISSPADNPLRVMAGVSYFKQWLDGNLSGSGKQLAAGSGIITPFVNNDRDRSYAIGGFGSISYDILDNLTIDLEGRYQKDASRQFTQSGSFAAGTIAFAPVSTDFTDFLPRVILTFKPTPRTTLYGSYSIGALTGIANTQFNNVVNRVAASPRGNIFNSSDPVVVRQRMAALLNLTDTVPEVVPAEKIDHYEIGWKQSFLGGRGAFTLAGYHIKWRNMKSTAALSGIDLDNDGIADTIGPTLPAKSRIWGAEFSLDLEPLDGLNLSFNGEVVDHKFTDFLLYGVAAQIASPTGPISGVGTTLLQYPTYTLFGSARYTHRFSTDLRGYVGGEVNFTGKQYLDEPNVAWISPYQTVNLRAGVTRETFNLEVFVNNLFNYDGPAGGRRNSLGDGTVGITVYPHRLRTIGLRSSITF